MKTIAIYNTKGGVGKTATAVNLSYLACKAGYKTLLIDLDAQGAATFYFRIRPKKNFSGKKLLRGGARLRDNIRGTDFEGLDLVPAVQSFRNLDLKLDREKDSKMRLTAVLRPLQKRYDMVIIDVPPNLTLLAENVLYCADLLLVPTIPTTLSMLSLQKLRDFMKRNHIPRKKLSPFFSMVERRKRLHQQTIADHQSSGFLKSRIPYAAAVEKMGERREPLFCFSHRSPAAQAYRDLWHEVSRQF